MDFTNLYTFTCDTNDGCDPESGLTLVGNVLYGTRRTSSDGGVQGTVVAVRADGSGVTGLHSFAGYPSDGATPRAGLVLSGNTLYGTTYSGGDEDGGTIFSLSLPVLTQLAFSLSGGNIVLTWPTNVTGFTLQSATKLFSSSTWSTVSPPPIVVNGQNTVTNPVLGTAMFYRLSQ